MRHLAYPLVLAGCAGAAIWLEPVLHVNVFDGKSDAVPQLPQSAFTVIEEGQPQTITFFNDADVPVAAGLVVDNSSSMITRRAMVVAGPEAFAA